MDLLNICNKYVQGYDRGLSIGTKHIIQNLIKKPLYPILSNERVISGNFSHRKHHKHFFSKDKLFIVILVLLRAGNCLETSEGKLIRQSCIQFFGGCPMHPFRSSEILKCKNSNYCYIFHKIITTYFNLRTLKYYAFFPNFRSCLPSY